MTKNYFNNACTCTDNVHSIYLCPVNVPAEEFLLNASEDDMNKLGDFLLRNDINLEDVISEPTSYIIVFWGEMISTVHKVVL